MPNEDTNANPESVNLNNANEDNNANDNEDNVEVGKLTEESGNAESVKDDEKELEEAERLIGEI